MCSHDPHAPRRPIRLLISLLLALLSTGAVLAQAPAAASPTEAFQAPTRLFLVPAIDSLATLPGVVEMRYPLGALDRAARLQTRLSGMLRRADADFSITVYVLNREEWQQARFDMPYGVPIRVGPSGLAVPAAGDAETAKLWQDLEIPLPSVPGIAYRGGPGHAPSELMADVLALILTGEIHADRTRLAGDEFWLRGLVSHLVALDYIRRSEPGLKAELDLLYGQIRGQEGRPRLAASDYRAAIDMADWMWFQAHFHRGAEVVFEEEGRGVFRRLEKMRRRHGGVVTAAAVLEEWEDLRAWYDRNFAAISRRPLE